MKHKTINNSSEINISEILAHKDLVSIKFLYCESFPDLSPLHDLDMLSEISLLSCNKIENLSFLAPLIGLKRLRIDGCMSLVNLSAIQNFEKLESLKVASLSSLQEIPPLNMLANLRSFSLMTCRSVTDFAPLATLEHTTQLSVDYSESLTSSLSSKQLDNTIDLTVNYVRDATSLQNLGKFNNIQKLTLGSCRLLTDIVAMPKLDNLTELSMSACDNLSSLTPLGKLKKLEHLTVNEGENVKTLAFISELKKLTSIALKKFRLVDDITPLGELKSLTNLSVVKGLRLRDINALSKLSKLEHLDLTECINIADLNPISELKQLKRLDLSSCYSIVDLKSLKKLSNLSHLDIRSCYLEKGYHFHLKPLKISNIVTDHRTISRKSSIPRIFKANGKSRFTKNAEKYSFHDQDVSIYFNRNAQRFSFDQFKLSLEEFQIDELEKFLRDKFDRSAYYPFNRDANNLPCERTTYGPNYTENEFVRFDIIDNQGYLDDCFSCDWLTFGPLNIKNQVKYRFIEELELCSKEQVRTLILDGFMSSLDERYFWCKRLVTWIEDNCHLYETDIENTLVELMEFYMVDGIDSDGYESTGFSNLFIHAISMLADAANKELSTDTVRAMYGLSYMYFSSYVMPSRVDLEIYAEKFKWEVVKSKFNEVYGDNSDYVVDSQFASLSAADSKQSNGYSERYLQIADSQATRASDRAFRAISILVDISSRASELTSVSSLKTSITEIHIAISNMSPTNSQAYTKKLLSVNDIDQPQCSTHIRAIFDELNI